MSLPWQDAARTHLSKQSEPFKPFRMFSYNRVMRCRIAQTYFVSHVKILSISVTRRMRTAVADSWHESAASTAAT